jgi:23S rRNA (guanosine2251-2'-O)-methyltransferase
MPDRQLDFEEERPEQAAGYLEQIQKKPHPLSLLAAGLDDVRNIGALFRLADAARLEHLYFLGWPQELNPKKLKRISRSTVRWVPHSVLQMEEAVALSQRRPFIGLEITTHSVPYTACQPEAGSVLVLGHEAQGIPASLLRCCRQCIHLPMYGLNTSMNVAMAAGIATYRLLEQLGAGGE